MLHENALVVEYPVPEKPVSMSGIDYDDEADSPFEDELVEADTGEDYTPYTEGPKVKRKLQDAHSIPIVESKKKCKRNFSPALKHSILTNHNMRATFDSKANRETSDSLNNKKSSFDHSDQLKRESALACINLKDHLTKSSVCCSYNVFLEYFCMIYNIFEFLIQLHTKNTTPKSYFIGICKS